MSDHKNFDIIIIGAGSIGTPAAMSLSKAGFKVLVLDGKTSVGQGSNKHAIGGIRATHSDPAKISLCQQSLIIFSTWKEKYGDDIEWYKGGYCFVAYREQEEKSLKELLKTQKKYGLNIDWFGKNELVEQVPDLNRVDLLGGTLSPDDGNASPLLATHAIYEQAKGCGAEFYFSENVQDICVHNGKITGVITSKGRYGSEIVLNAAGGWSNEISKMVGKELPVKPDSHEAAITEPVARFLQPMIVDTRPAPGSSNYYFYQHMTGQIVFCMTPSPNIWGFDTRETSGFLPMVAKRMIEILPRLTNIRVRRTWRGLYPMTPDGFPIIGWDNEIQGMLLATGMCGQGFMLGPGVGELLVRMANKTLTQKDKEILLYLSPERDFKGQEKLK